MAMEETQPPAGAAADWTIPQGDRYSPDEHAMWDQPFARQSRMLPGRVRRQVDCDDRHGAC
jgi:phenylalanine-4-hydroxylase